MIITSQQLEQIARAGGGMVLDATTLTFNQLRGIVTAAGAGNAKITLKNLSALTAGQLEELAGLAPALVTFDLSPS